MFKMGGSGFPGAEDFGGQDTNFNCLPDYDPTKCPSRENNSISLVEKILFFSKENESTGKLSDKFCKFLGDDYRECPFYLEK
jgi:hypothetical protein